MSAGGPLLVNQLRALHAAVQAGEPDLDARWDAVLEAVEASGWDDVELQVALMDREAEVLARRVTAWDEGRDHLPPPDRAVLKRALKAFRKRLKLQKLDDESHIGGGPFSSGQKSGIVAIRPPAGYPDEVWTELVRAGRLIDDGHGFLELAGE